MTRDNHPTNQDEWLADFADQVLDGKETDLLSVGSDPEMRALADTILRLNHAFPRQGADPASVKRIQAGVLKRWREEEQKKARWRNILRPSWLEQLRRPQFGMTVAVVAVVILLVVVAPYLTIDGPVTATAGSDTPFNTFTLLLLGILIAIGIWLSRRKS